MILVDLTLGNITLSWTLSSANVWIKATSCAMSPSAFLLNEGLNLQEH